ncbi:uncharacterized protein VTP21DRAFT_1542 [Calcarisporiella thermophila]|uniref:uncharacterized protein n=1 Tax=Calcarisporiella thermophila TaxID=911321 RepID=UPI003744963F
MTELILPAAPGLNFTSDALRAVNTFLDEFLHSLLTSAHPSHARFKQVTTRLLPNDLGRRAIVEAELEWKTWVEHGCPVEPMLSVEDAERVVRTWCAGKGKGRVPGYIGYLGTIVECLADYVVGAVADGVEEGEWVRARDVYDALRGDREVGEFFERTRVKQAIEKKLACDSDDLDQPQLDEIHETVDIFLDRSPSLSSLATSSKSPMASRRSFSSQSSFRSTLSSSSAAGIFNFISRIRTFKKSSRSSSRKDPRMLNFDRVVESGITKRVTLTPNRLRTMEPENVLSSSPASSTSSMVDRNCSIMKKSDELNRRMSVPVFVIEPPDEILTPSCSDSDDSLPSPDFYPRCYKRRDDSQMMMMMGERPRPTSMVETTSNNPAKASVNVGTVHRAQKVADLRAIFENTPRVVRVVGSEKAKRVDRWSEKKREAEQAQKEAKEKRKEAAQEKGAAEETEASKKGGEASAQAAPEEGTPEAGNGVTEQRGHTAEGGYTVDQIAPLLKSLRESLASAVVGMHDRQALEQAIMAALDRAACESELERKKQEVMQEQWGDRQFRKPYFNWVLTKSDSVHFHAACNIEACPYPGRALARFDLFSSALESIGYSTSLLNFIFSSLPYYVLLRALLGVNEHSLILEDYFFHPSQCVCLFSLPRPFANNCQILLLIIYFFMTQLCNCNSSTIAPFSLFFLK